VSQKNHENCAAKLASPCITLMQVWRFITQLEKILAHGI